MPDVDRYADERAERAKARETRRAFNHGPEKGLARQLRSAMGEYSTMREQGVSREDACKGLELLLRDVFPQSKFPPRCTACDDTGYQERTCDHRMRCGRKWCSGAEDAFEHLYVEPCGCPAGDKFRRKVWTPSEDAPIAAGKVKRKPSGFQRAGRT